MSYALARSLNNLLAGIVCVLAGYIVCAPFIPELQLYLSTHTPRPSIQAVSEQTSESIPPSNILSISEIGIYGKIYEGEGADTMNKGIWHRPHTSTPDVGGNTVLVAHRHLYTSGPDTFYHLPKLQKGSKITLYWQQKKYSYVVVDTRIVEPDESHIEKNTLEHQLTLYTCTPLWTSAKRFVVTAKPI